MSAEINTSNSGQARLDARRSEVAVIERERPLVRKILEMLVDDPALSAREITERLKTSPEAVQQELDRLHEHSHWVVPTDGLYELSAEGEYQLNQHRAHGVHPLPPPPLTREESIRLLRMALALNKERYEDPSADYSPEEFRRRIGSIASQADELDAPVLKAEAERLL